MPRLTVAAQRIARLQRERALLFKRARQLLMQRNRAIGMLEDIRDGVCYTARDLNRAIVAAGGEPYFQPVDDGHNNVDPY